MPTYLIERYRPGRGVASMRDEAARVFGAIGAPDHEATSARYLRSIFLPEEETCFHLFEASSAGAVIEACVRARLAFDRVLAAVDIAADELGAAEIRELRDRDQSSGRGEVQPPGTREEQQ